MNTIEIINTVLSIAIYIAFGLSCFYVGYNKGTRHGRKKGYTEGGSFVCNKIRDIINETPKDQHLQSIAWISTEDRLPLQEGTPREYLVMIDGFTYPTTLRYSAEEGFYDEDGDETIFYKVLWWAPLPLAPDAEPAPTVNRALGVPRIGDTVYSVMLNDLDDDDGGYHIEPWIVYDSGITKSGDIIVMSWDGETYILDNEEEGLSFSTLEKAEQHLKNIQERNKK